MREIDEKHIRAEAMEESGRLGYEFYRQECFPGTRLWLRGTLYNPILFAQRCICTSAVNVLFISLGLLVCLFVLWEPWA